MTCEEQEKKFSIGSIDWPVTSKVGPGLEGVVATSTQISGMDGDSGLLCYRGIPIESFAKDWAFEQTAYLLIKGKTPADSPAQFAEFMQNVRKSRALPPEVIAIIRSLPKEVHPTRMLRAGVSAMGCFELRYDADLSGDSHWEELRIIGQTAALVGEVIRHRSDFGPVIYSKSSSLADGMLRSIRNHEPAQEDIDTLDMVWSVTADHGLDTPSFTSLIVGSTKADPYTNAVAGLSAIRGPKLGGAGETVVAMLQDFGTVAGAVRGVQVALKAKKRIPGFGHRVFKIADPRVQLLKNELRQLSIRNDSDLFSIVQAVEDEAGPSLSEKGVYPNLNLYAAPIFHLLGMDPESVPCMYAVGRMAGLLARVYEYSSHSRLFRPVSNYTGSEPRPYIPLEDR